MVLISTNAALMIFLRRQQKRRLSLVQSNRANKKSSVNITVIALTLLFVVLTFPGSMNDMFYNTWIVQEWGLAVIYTFDSIDFTYHALSFPIVMLSNPRFRCEFRKVLRLVRKYGREKTQSVLSGLYDS